MKHQDEVPFIQTLRALAPIPVVWDHIGGMADWHFHVSWKPVVVFDRLVGTPLQLYERGSHLGVMIFFLISGYIISHVADREDRASFAIKRFFRLFPALAVAIAAVWVANSIGTIPPSHFRPIDYLLSLFLLDQAFWPGSSVLMVTWTLFPEVVFYALACFLLPTMKDRPVFATALLTAAAFVIVVSSNIHGTSPKQISHLGYLTLFLIGRVFFLLSAGRISREVALAFIAGQMLLLYLLFTGLWPQKMWQNQSKPWTYPSAVIIFYGALLWNPACSWRPLRFLGDISYSFYLLHVPVGYFVLAHTYSPQLGFTVPFILAVSASLLAAWLSFRFVERPGRRMGRQLVARWSSPSAATSIPAP
jgi:exopolysaccharide production protein ExoZ